MKEDERGGVKAVREIRGKEAENNGTRQSERLTGTEKDGVRETP